MGVHGWQVDPTRRLTVHVHQPCTPPRPSLQPTHPPASAGGAQCLGCHLEAPAAWAAPAGLALPLLLLLLGVQSSTAARARALVVRHRTGRTLRAPASGGAVASIRVCSVDACVHRLLATQHRPGPPRPTSPSHTSPAATVVSSTASSIHVDGLWCRPFAASCILSAVPTASCYSRKRKPTQSAHKEQGASLGATAGVGGGGGGGGGTSGSGYHICTALCGPTWRMLAHT